MTLARVSYLWRTLLFALNVISPDRVLFNVQQAICQPVSLTKGNPCKPTQHTHPSIHQNPNTTLRRASSQLRPHLSRKRSGWDRPSRDINLRTMVSGQKTFVPLLFPHSFLARGSITLQVPRAVGGKKCYQTC